MLISYALIIFALAFAVVAPPPSGSPSDTWLTLEGNEGNEGNKYLASLVTVPETDPPVMYRWYRLKIVAPGEKPIWPRDCNLDHVMQFVSIENLVKKVIYTQLKRIKSGGQVVLTPGLSFPQQKGQMGLNDWHVPLEGFWGRGHRFDVSDDFWKPFVVVPHSSLQPSTGAVVEYDKVIEIQNFGSPRGGEQRKIRFLDEHMKPHTFSAALTAYTLPQVPSDKLKKNQRPRDQRPTKPRVILARPSRDGPQ
jgi:hypothetical protein